MVTSDRASEILTAQTLAVIEVKRAINALIQAKLYLSELGCEATEIPFMEGYLKQLVVRTKEFNVDNLLF